MTPDEDFVPDVRLDLTMHPAGNVQMGLSALGLKPYVLVEVAPDDSSLVLHTQTGGPGMDLDGLKTVVELLTLALSQAPDEEGGK